jgi:hypothetical protein
MISSQAIIKIKVELKHDLSYDMYLPIPCLFVLLQLVRGYESSEDHPGTWNLKSHASCALDHLFLPNLVLINHIDLHRLILMGPNRLP